MPLKDSGVPIDNEMKKLDRTNLTRERKGYDEGPGSGDEAREQPLMRIRLRVGEEAGGRLWGGGQPLMRTTSTEKIVQ